MKLTVSWKSKVFWALVAALTLFRISLFLSIPIEALANAMHDDLLQVEQGCEFFSFRWFGPYYNRTLVKGISFPLFLAVCKWLCMPYGLGLALFYIGSIIIFLYAIRSLIHNPYLNGILYLFLLYSPAMLSASAQQRAYNISLVPPTLLILGGSCVALFLRRNQSVKILLPWALLAGAGLAFFWNIRQDSVWFAPFVTGALAISVICIFLEKTDWKSRLSRCAVMLSPFLIFGMAMFGIAGINYLVYGVFTVNERTDSSCADVMSDLIQMDVPKVRENVWVSREAVELAMECSETFGSIRESIEEVYQSGWVTDGEIPGDIIVWALRDAVADAGYFTDGATSEQFFKQVHEEISDAYDRGAYKKKTGIFLSSLSDEFILEEDLGPLLQTALAALKRISFIEATEVKVYYGTGTKEQLRFFESVLGSPVVYPDGVGFDTDPVASAALRPISVAQKFTLLYRMLSWILVPLSVICYLWLTIAMIGQMRRKEYASWHLWLIVTGLMGSIAVYILEVSWFTNFLSDAQHSIYHYCTGAITLMQLIQIFTIVWILQFRHASK